MSVSSSHDPIEETMASLVSDLLPGIGNWTRHDDGTVDSAYDFDVETSIGTMALEVTRWTSKARREFEEAVQRQSGRTPTLGGHWSLNVDSFSRNVAEILRMAPRHLATFESLGIDEFPVSTDGSLAYRDAVHSLRKLGVVTGERYPRGEGWIGIVPLVVDMTTLPHYAAETQLLVDENSSKLGKSARPFGILGIWVDRFSWTGQVPMSRLDPPDQPLTLPAGTDAVLLWRDGWMNNLAVDRVWSYGRADLDWIPSGWADLTHLLEVSTSG